MASTEKKTKKSKRARLGRGLGALIEQSGSPSVAIELGQEQPSHAVHLQNSSPDDLGERVLEVKVRDIVPNPHQPRRVFDEQALQTLADSIKTHGLMQPIVVRPASSGSGYELVAGERRWRAAKLACLDTIRAVQSDANDKGSAELAIIENIQRADLNPIERALGFTQLVVRFGMTQQQLADRMGMSRSAVANLMRLLELDESLQELVSQGTLTVGHAKVLLSCIDLDLRKSLAQQCVDEGWTVRLLENKSGKPPKNVQQIVVEPNKIGTQSQDRLSSVLRDMEQRMSEQLGTRVMLHTNENGSKGRISIEFYDLDQFDGLLVRMGVQGEEFGGG